MADNRISKQIVEHIIDGNAIEAQELIQGSLYRAADTALQEVKKRVVAEMCDCQGKQELDEKSKRKARLQEKRNAFKASRKK